DREREPPVGEDCRMNAARELAQLLECQIELEARAVEYLGGTRRVRREPRLREPHGYRQRDEPLLGAVVEVALELAPRCSLRLDDAGRRPPQLLLLPLLLRHVDGADEIGRLAVEDANRVNGPGDRQRLAVAREPGALTLGDRAAGGLHQRVP